MSSLNKYNWKQLAPRPYSSLWLWCAHRSLKQQPHGFSSAYGDVVYGGDYEDDDDDEDDYDYNGSCGPIDRHHYDVDSDESTDWLDSTLASLDQSFLSPSECIIQSIPVNPVNSDQNSINIKKIKDKAKLKRYSVKREDNKRRKVNHNCDFIEKASADEAYDYSEEITMKILDVTESKSIVVLKKSHYRYFSFIYGDLKVTSIVGSICCDGYTLNQEESAFVSTGFGRYQICIVPLKFQRYPSKDHLIEVLDNAGLSATHQETIVDYLVNRDSSITESLVISLEKWRLPSLTALKLYVNPESEFSHWFQLSFSETRSPVVQWSRMIERLIDDIQQRSRPKDTQEDAHPSKGKSTKGVRVVMLGGVNCGKSSLTRHLCNRIISSVAAKVHVIDCDPGQSEFTNPGTLSAISVKEPILSPPFVNCLRFNNDILTSCSIAGTSVQNNPDLYVLNVAHLWKTFLSSISDEDYDKPVIINAMGWTQGLGIHLMVDVVRIFQPTHVIEIKRPPYDGKDNFPFDCNPDTLNQLDGWLFKPNGGPSSSSNISEFSTCSLQPYLNFEYIRLSNQFAPKRCSSTARANRVNNQLAYFCLMDEIIYKNFYELEVISIDLDKLHFHVEYEFPIDKQLLPHVIKDSWVHLCSIDEPDPSSNYNSINDSSVNQTNQRQISEQDRPSTSTDRSESQSLIEKIDVTDDYLISHQLSLANIDSNDNSGQASARPGSSVPPGFSQLNPDAKPFWGSECNINLKILPFLRENKCLGSAIIREIDLVNNKLMLISPEPPERIAQVNCIVRPQGLFVPDPLKLGNH